MKIEHQYRRMTLWNGKMSRTRYHCTAEEIRKNHPEAVRVEGSLRVMEIPETEEERLERWKKLDTSLIGTTTRKPKE